jgi:hypothetical protein
VSVLQIETIESTPMYGLATRARHARDMRSRVSPIEKSLSGMLASNIHPCMRGCPCYRRAFRHGSMLPEVQDHART